MRRRAGLLGLFGLLFGVAALASDTEAGQVTGEITALTHEGKTIHLAFADVQLTSRDTIRRSFQAVTTEPAAILGLEGYGLEPGCRADLVVLEAKDPIEAIRLKAARLFVLRAGQIVARTAPRTASLDLPGRPPAVSFLHATPAS